MQVRNVENFVNGVRVATNGNFPFEHRFVTPLIAQQPALTIQARATDTGGNVALTEEMVITLIEDATPPKVARVSPGFDTVSREGSVAVVTAAFTEPLDTSTIRSSAIQLFSAGPDGIPGNEDDIAVAGGVLSYRADINSVFLTFESALPAGVYRAVLSPSITDLTGNHLSGQFEWTFHISLVSWDGGGDGVSWQDPLNWSTDSLPQPFDFVFIDAEAETVISHSQGSSIIHSLESREPLVVANSSLTVEDGMASIRPVTFDGGTGIITGDLAAPDLSLLNASTLTHRGSRVADGTAIIPQLEIETGTLTVDATSSIDVSGQGYLGGMEGDNTSRAGRTLGNSTTGGASDPANTGPFDAGAGSYGGRGASSSNGVYGDYRNPNELGSGGAAEAHHGGSGGGLVSIKADAIILDGAVRANGGLADSGCCDSGGNGSGGGIRINVGTLTGAGSISANGGEQKDGRQTQGGGGRVALYYQNMDGFTGTLKARGGERNDERASSNGGAGTVYLKASSQEHGDLIIDNGGVETDRFSTPLRSVGPGVNTGLEVGRLIDESASFPVPDPETGAVGLVGLELNPNTGQGQTFTIIDNTATEIITDPADGDMTLVAGVGNPYIGQYFWDNGDVVGSANVRTEDECISTGTLSVKGGAHLVCKNVTLP